jgi:microcystin-dependent protein
MDPYIGEIRLFTFGFAPRGWEPCDGRSLSVEKHKNLFFVIGDKFGSDNVEVRKPISGIPDSYRVTVEEQFCLPKLESPGPGLHYCISLDGIFPLRP